MTGPQQNKRMIAFVCSAQDGRVQSGESLVRKGHRLLTFHPYDRRFTAIGFSHQYVSYHPQRLYSVTPATRGRTTEINHRSSASVCSYFTRARPQHLRIMQPVTEDGCRSSASNGATYLTDGHSVFPGSMHTRYCCNADALNLERK